ncbi:hypothetical protein [Domibacillus iocasae]|uniref:Uncharacterized protein n=1 Tax=Domibacillus iocasae TaxID=1714016 RepID=A0A1E7DRX3_9BACI|nr:hypothetical protein [Domibacillus iocasae]OES45831.1 hypothetical protein BA724_03235 [Domibacillus iocasae]
MDFDTIKDKLEALCCYNNIRITYSFDKDKHPYLKAQCKNGTETIQVRILSNNELIEFDSIEKAASAIEMLLQTEPLEDIS